MQVPSGPDTSSPRAQPTQAAAERDRLFNLSLDLLCVAGLDGYFRQVNPSWTRVLGWTPEELLARPVADFMHPEDRERTLQARAGLAKGVPVRGLENRYLCKDGAYRWLSWQSSVEPGAKTVFAVARDITERRQADQERLVLSKLESTGILAGGIAHDFNNLLASLLLNLEMIEVFGPLNDRQKPLLRQALETVESSQTLTEQLLTFADGGAWSRNLTDLRPLLQHSLELGLGGSSLLGECLLPPDLWPAEVDASQISQVVRNLVLNAREASAEGGRVMLRAENLPLAACNTPNLRPADYLHISVHDEGAGIPAEALPKVFDPYFSTKRRGPQKGMGLGLTICHAVVQKHGGTLLIDSTPGGGTTVHCYLPAALPAAAILHENRTAHHSAPVASNKILVMDDEAGLREIVALTLSQIGYTTALAKNGEEAVALYTEARNSGAPFAAVILDMTVKGGMGGGETIRILRDQDPHVRAVLMTGYSQEETLRDFARHGFSSALTKPFSMENLRTTLSAVLKTSATG
ncbi:MAG: ATP-binding protein [Rariglobus sp.]